MVPALEEGDGHITSLQGSKCDDKDVPGEGRMQKDWTSTTSWGQGQGLGHVRGNH